MNQPASASSHAISTPGCANLETARPGIVVNIIIEACYGGSFITDDDSISREGRLIVSSTSDNHTAYASHRGALFSDFFWSHVAQGYSVLKSFQAASNAAQKVHVFQIPWVDGNGNRLANEAADTLVAAQRGFSSPGTFDNLWAPTISDFSLAEAPDAGGIALRATVTDDVAVAQVWASIFPPGYTPPPPGDQLSPGSPYTITLNPLPDSNEVYAAIFTELQTAGAYRIVVHASDSNTLSALPLSQVITVTGNLYLPLVKK